MSHILMVDDETQFRTSVVRALKRQDYRVTCIDSVDTLASSLAIHEPDLVLLALTFKSGASGLEACRGLRNWSPVPVIIVSSSHDEKSKVTALDAGADDYLVKPFGIEELLARIRAIQRRLDRSTVGIRPIHQIGDLSIDLSAALVLLHDEPLHLTRNEYKLLRALVLAGGKPVSYRNLLAAVYGHEGGEYGERSTIRTLVKQLRRKLNDDLDNPRYLLTEAGLGYRCNMLPQATQTA